MLIAVLIIGLILGLMLAGGGSRSSYHQLPFKHSPDVPPPPEGFKRLDPQGDNFPTRDD